MFLIQQQQQQSRNRKESLIPIRSSLEDLKIEILDVNSMNEYTVIENGCEQVVEVVTSDDSDSYGSSSRPRKRAKLDHLSVEQKAQHRKMMNRISAQSARDRQRALMTQQEEGLKKLNNVTEQLKEENKTLKKKNIELLAENGSLKSVAVENEKLKKFISELEKKLESQTVPVVSSTVSDSVSIESSCSSSEPAVPAFVPLPKGLELQLTLIFTLIMIWEYSNGISTLQKFCNIWRIFRNRYLAKILNLQHLSKLSPQDLKDWTLQEVFKSQNHQRILPNPPDKPR